MNRATRTSVRDTDRRRDAQPHRKAMHARVRDAWKRRFPGRVRAQQQARRAGAMPPTCCENCGLARRVERHHHDYTRPLVVIWLCKPCHALADKLRRRWEAVTV
jgi:hypothetical protein